MDHIPNNNDIIRNSFILQIFCSFSSDPLLSVILLKIGPLAQKNRLNRRFFCKRWSEWGDSNSRHLAPKASALPTALHPVMEFSNCGQTCGQRRFLTSYQRGEKCCQPKCPKAFRGFQGLRLEPGPHAPKSRALPTALHPDIQFSCMIPCGEGKSKFFVSVGGAVVKPDFSEVFQPGNFHRNLLSQGLPGFRFWGNG